MSVLGREWIPWLILYPWRDDQGYLSQRLYNSYQYWTWCCQLKEICCFYGKIFSSWATRYQWYFCIKTNFVFPYRKASSVLQKHSPLWWWYHNRLLSKFLIIYQIFIISSFSTSCIFLGQTISFVIECTFIQAPSPRVSFRNPPQDKSDSHNFYGNQSFHSFLIDLHAWGGIALSIWKTYGPIFTHLSAH